MANEVAAAEVQAAKDLTIELIRRTAVLSGGFQDQAKAIAQAFKVIYSAVIRPLED